jgi:hypothetical protein
MGGKHSVLSLVSVESQLGTLPVSALLPRSLHTRSGLGRSAELRRTHSNLVPPYRTRAPYPFEGGPLEYSSVTSRARVPSESTATALLPHHPARCPRHASPRYAALLGAEPTDPTLLRRTRKRRWQEAGTHRYARLMSAESGFGTLPCSLLLLRYLHTRSGLGRSAVLRRTHINHVPLPYLRTVPIMRGPPWVLLSHMACPRTPLSTATALLPSRPCSMPPTCIPPALPRTRSRADRSEQPPPHMQTSSTRGGHAQSFKLCERGERARHTPRQLV